MTRKISDVELIRKKSLSDSDELAANDHHDDEKPVAAANDHFDDEKSDDEKAVATETNKWSKCMKCSGLGMICALISAMVFSVNALIAKLIEGLHPVQIGASRAYVQFLILLPFLFYKRNEIDILGPRGLRRFLWLRGVVGSTTVMCLYLAIGAMSLGNAVTITYLSMIFVPFIARIFLKERLKYTDLVFAAISLTGVVLIAQPSFLFPQSRGQQPETSGIGVLYSVITAILQSSSIVLIRKLGHETSAPLNILYYSACGAVIMTVVLCAVQEFQFPCYHDLPFVFLLGILGVLGQYFLTLSLQLERAGTVGVLRSFQIIVVYVLQVTVLGNFPSTLSIVGAGLVFSSSIGIGAGKILSERKRRNSMKRAE